MSKTLKSLVRLVDEVLTLQREAKARDAERIAALNARLKAANEKLKNAVHSQGG